MRNIIRTSIQQIFADRGLLLACSGIAAGALIYIVYVALSLQPSDLQLATRYTSFGDTQFYRNKWYYLLSFIAFGLIFMVVHIGMIVKLYVSDMRQLAYGLVGLSYVILLLMFVYTYSVLGIAYLS